MPKTIYKDFSIIHGFRPRAERRFYFFLVEKNGSRASKHCIWVKRSSHLAMMPDNDIKAFLVNAGLKRVYDKIDRLDETYTLQIFDRDEPEEIVLNEVKEKIVFDW